MTAFAEDENDRRGFFSERRVNRGLVASLALHILGIGVSGVYLSDAAVFDENQEAIPIEVVTEAELNQVTKGDKTAAPAPTPQTKAERQADQDFTPPKPVERPAEKDLAPPPPPPIRDIPEPTPRMALAPETAPEPPPRPPEPKPPEPKPPEPAAAPQPPRRPPDPVQREAKAEPVPEKPAPTPPPRPRVEPRREPPRPDQLARLIEEKREQDKPAQEKPAQEHRNADADAIRKLISQERTQERTQERADERAQQRAAAARENARQASLGTATARAEKMSPSMWGQLDGFLQEQYRACWNKFGFEGQTYIPQIRVLFNADGSLAAEPSLVNPPGDVGEKALAASAMRAVRRCDPIRIPPQYAPYHAQWKARTLRFDPQEM